MSFIPLQMEFRGHHVHAAGRLSPLLAQETDADAAHDLGRNLRLLVSRVGGPLRHRQRLGRPPSETRLSHIKIRDGRTNQTPCVCTLQISRMLVVDPKQRFTAMDVLNHSFFSQYVVDEVREFSPYRRFKVSIGSTRFPSRQISQVLISRALADSPPAGHLHDRSRHNAHLLQLPPRQTRHQGSDPE